MGFEQIAHRGCGAVYPENTVRAVREAGARLPAVEVDVRRCATGELVCVHDATVDRVTGGSGPVAEHALADLRALDVGDGGEPIPTLEEVVAAVPADTALQVELKERGLAADVLEALADAAGAVRLSSFEAGALREVQEADAGADIPTGYLFEADPAAKVDLAADLGCANVHPHWRTCAETDVVAKARERGFGVYAWGAESDPEAVAAARAAGADGVTVDRPDL
jgi:glycerophosphoryl diester phosphodiesterase